MAIILPYKGIYPKIAEDAFIAENAVIIGNVEIGSKANIWYGCVVRGDVNSITIGPETNVQDSSIIHVNRKDGPTIIGAGVTIGHMALLHGCVVEDYAFIGMGAKVIDYVTVKTHAMVAAGSVVSPHKTIPTGELWAGVPSRFLRKMTEAEIAYITISKDNYVRLAAEYK